MRPLVDALMVFAFVFGSGLLGLYLRPFLPEQHLKEDSVSMVRLCTGVIATLAALVLGLLVASAKGNYDRVSDEVTHSAVSVMLLDRTLAQYGPQTNEIRSLLREAVASTVKRVFSQDSRGLADLDTHQGPNAVEHLQDELRKLAPESDTQRMLQARALEISNDVAKTRLLAITEANGSMPSFFLIILVLWLAIMFAGFGLVTAKNPTVIVTLFLCALSLAGAVLMIEELNRPLEGLMKVSGDPMRYALAHLGE